MLKNRKRNGLSEVQPHLPGGLTFLFSLSCCLILANLYYAQAIVSDIAAGIGLDLAASGTVVAMLQLGYLLGTLFLGPLGDVLENRRLIAAMALGLSASMLAAGLSVSAAGFLSALLGVGIFSSATQMTVAFAVSLAASDERGKVLGLVGAGLFLGIALARPAASLVAGLWGWRAVFFLAAACMLALSALLWRVLPKKAPAARDGIHYGQILRSMAALIIRVPRLPLRLMIPAAAFFSYTMFWTAAPVLLRENLGFSPAQVALFALAGLISPPCVIVAGRFLDRGLGPFMVGAAALVAMCGCLLAAFPPACAFTLTAAVLLLDPGVSIVTMSVQRDILTAVPEARNRMNSLNISCNFCAGGLGAALGPWLLSGFGWTAVATSGAAFLFAAFVMNALLHAERRRAQA